jgi:hypothetical protein
LRQFEFSESGLVEFESRRVKVLAEPLDRVLMRFVRRIAKRIEPLVVAMNAAHVVKRSGGFPGKALRDVVRIAAGRAFFQLNQVLPRIAEVVFVDDPVALRSEDIADQRVVGLAVLLMFISEYRVGRHDVESLRTAQGRVREFSAGRDKEVIEVRVGPFEDALNDVVQVV